ncbi:T6SS immunity protein Tli4 family protein [Salinicola sp. CPA57]|uniref:T6SS immunity protein Tli4 family protein n=1 Tax=Salinicola sp. CPA57 TaxID=1949080 RepID=UPI001E308AB2|nr:T6SS immunity protein Tli4 family protein [Salinicola sp. CPA57]
MPSQLKLSFSSLTVNEAKISATPNSRKMFRRFIDKRKAELEAMHTVDAGDQPFLKRLIQVSDDMVIIDRNESPHKPDAARLLEGYKFEGLTMFSVKLTAIDVDDEKYREQRKLRQSNKSERLKQVEYLLNHLSPRKSGEIPERPGLCFAHGFLAGGSDQAIPGAAVPTRKEQIGMRFSDNKNRDIYIHFYTDSTIAEEDTLLDRTDQAERALANDQDFSVLRKGEVDLDGIDQAEEWLSAGTTDENVKGNYFNLEANSRIGSPGAPYVDISLRNGQFAHGEDHPAIDKASLTDAEAVGLWDAITRTFKPRPGAF